MLRSIVNKLIAFYLLPLRITPKLFFYVKGVFFTSANEHLYWMTRYIKRHWDISADSIIIDVGGFNGDTSLYFASQFKGQKVYCIEPNARMWPSVDRVAATHKEISIKKMALGRTRGEGVLHVTANDLSSSLNPLNTRGNKGTPAAFQAMLKEEATAIVAVSTLDEEFKNCASVMFIKLDTQGTELDILNGGIQTLAKTKFILTEMNNHQFYTNTCQYYEVDDFLRQHSFKLVDVVVSYRGDKGMTEYDALYENVSL